MKDAGSFIPLRRLLSLGKSPSSDSFRKVVSLYFNVNILMFKRAKENIATKAYRLHGLQAK